LQARKKPKVFGSLSWPVFQGVSMPRGGPKGNTKNFQSGAYSLLAMRTKGKPNGNTKPGREFRSREREYSQDLGGEKELSLAQQQIINDSVWCDFMIAAMDFELQNKKRMTRKGKPHPLIDLRMRVAAHRRENYKLMGLKRVLP
jgi:hypothetical protein